MLEILFERYSTRIIMSDQNNDQNSDQNNDQNNDQNILKIKYSLEKKMSFLKITDPRKRDEIVTEYLKTISNIQSNQLANRLGKDKAKAKYARRYKPITDVQEVQTNLSKNILTEIKKLPDVLEWPREVYTPAIEGPGVADTSMEKYGPIATKYTRKYTTKDADDVFGIHDDGEGLSIGDTRIHVNWDNIIVGEREYEGTPGLWELITMKKPYAYDDEDYDNYAEIMINTNALKRANDGESRTPKSNKGWKWNNLLKPIWAKRGEYEGTGVVILPKDADALLDRLELLFASKGAGNTGVGNEIVSICDELKRQNVLDVNAYKKLMSSL